MSVLVFLLEERSAQAMLKEVLPRLGLSPEIDVRYITFEGKQDLHKQLERRLRGWLEPETRFIVLRDQDSSDCIRVKEELSLKCRNAGRPEALVRIACCELESFYLGDLEAVERGLELNGLRRLQARSKFRTPDRLANPSTELKKLTKARYQKISGSRAIGQHLDLSGSNRSHSFNVLLAGIQRLASELA